MRPAVIAFLLVLSACREGGDSSGSSGQGGTQGGAPEAKKEAGNITIGILADLTGATADVGRPYNEGMLGYVDNLNAAGGIRTRRVVALSEDYAYKVPNAEEKYKKYVQAGVVAIQGWGTGDSEALRGKVKGDELPFMSASYAEVLTDPKQSPYNFVVAPTYSDQMRVALDTIAAEQPDAQVAVFHHDSPFGNAPIGDGHVDKARATSRLPSSDGGEPPTSGLLQRTNPGAKTSHPERVEPVGDGRRDWPRRSWA